MVQNFSPSFQGGRDEQSQKTKGGKNIVVIMGGGGGNEKGWVERADKQTTVMKIAGHFQKCRKSRDE